MCKWNKFAEFIPTILKILPLIRAIIQDNNFFGTSYWTMMNMNQVKHGKCDWSRDTSLYLQSSINVLNECHFTYSPNEQRERKSLSISYRVKCTSNQISKITSSSFIVVSEKLKLKLKVQNFCCRWFPAMNAQ